MFEIGKYTTLKILRETEPGLYLGNDSEAEEVILNIQNNPKVLDHLEN